MTDYPREKGAGCIVFIWSSHNLYVLKELMNMKPMKATRDLFNPSTCHQISSGKVHQLPPSNYLKYGCAVYMDRYVANEPSTLPRDMMLVALRHCSFHFWHGGSSTQAIAVTHSFSSHWKYFPVTLTLSQRKTRKKPYVHQSRTSNWRIRYHLYLCWHKVMVRYCSSS